MKCFKKSLHLWNLEMLYGGCIDDLYFLQRMERNLKLLGEDYSHIESQLHTLKHDISCVKRAIRRIKKL